MSKTTSFTSGPVTTFAIGELSNTGTLDVEAWAIDAAPAVPDDLDHSCSEEGRKYRAQYQLLLIERLRIHEYGAMEHLDGLIAEAGANFAREQLLDWKESFPF